MTPLRRAAVTTFCILVVLALFDTGAWWWLTGRMEAMVVAWQAQRASESIQARSDPMERAGWPFAAELVLPAAAIDAGFAAWQADRVRLRLSPWRPRTLVVAVSGAQRLRLGALPPVALTAYALSADVPLDGSDVTAVGHGVTATTAAGALQAALVTAHLAADGVTVAAFHMVVTNAPSPSGGAPLLFGGIPLPFGGAIEAASARLRLSAPFPVASSPAQALAAWAHTGGQVLADDVALHWGPLEAQGSFTASLDPAGQPDASGTLHLTGQVAMIDALHRAGAIDRNTARVAATLLGLLAHPGADGPAVDLPLTLRHGTLAAGAIPLAQIPLFTFP